MYHKHLEQYFSLDNALMSFNFVIVLTRTATLTFELALSVFLC